MCSNCISHLFKIFPWYFIDVFHLSFQGDHFLIYLVIIFICRRTSLGPTLLLEALISLAESGSRCLKEKSRRVS